jgi:hypothetical protein
MTQAVLKIALFVNGLIVVMILALRLLPNDDASIRTLLLPPAGCPAPCFMNVRAGITDSNTAAQFIRQHGWAKSPPFIARSTNDMNIRYVLWQWSGQQPSGIDIHRQGQMHIYKDHAAAVVIRTTLPLGAVWLVLGKTNQGTLSLSDIRSNTDMLVIMAYPEQGLLVRVVVPKHASQTALWTSVAEIESGNADTIAYFGGFHLPVLSRLWGTG